MIVLGNVSRDAVGVSTVSRLMNVFTAFYTHNIRIVETCFDISPLGNASLYTHESLKYTCTHVYMYPCTHVYMYGIHVRVYSFFDLFRDCQTSPPSLQSVEQKIRAIFHHRRAEVRRTNNRSVCKRVMCNHGNRRRGILYERHEQRRERKMIIIILL